MLAAACADDDVRGASPSSTVPLTISTSVEPESTGSTTHAPTTGAPATTAAVPDTPLAVPFELSDFAIGRVRLAGFDLVVAIVDDADLRPRGLMHVEDLMDLDGMVFAWSEDTESVFWMKETLVPLDIAWFDSTGGFVSETTMEPCPFTELCPSYAAAASYRFALETPAGAMPHLDGSSVLELVAGF